MDIKLLTMESFDNRRLNSVGSSRIRGRWIIDNWEECKAYEIGDNPDIMIYQKVYWREHMQEFDGIKIFDLCDPDWMEGRNLKEISEYIDAFVVSTEAIKEYLDHFCKKPVFVIKDRFDTSKFPKPINMHNGKIKTCVWYGYSTNAHVLEKAFSSLEELDIALTTISDKGIYGTTKFIKYDYETIYDDLQSFDVALLPPAGSDDPKFKYKSNNKTIECQLLGLPVAKDHDDLVRFMDPKEREKESKQRYEEVIKEYTIDKSVSEWKNVINSLVD